MIPSQTDILRYLSVFNYRYFFYFMMSFIYFEADKQDENTDYRRSNKKLNQGSSVALRAVVMSLTSG